MNWNDAGTIFRQIQEATRGDAVLLKLENNLLTQVVRYARIRTDWQFADYDRRREFDASRTVAHNALIDASNILSRAMNERGKDIAWRAQLGQDRREIGDFACYVHCLLGISAR